MTKSKAELAALVASLREQLRVSGEMMRSAVSAFSRSVAERDAALAALQARKPVRLKKAAELTGIPKSTIFDWVAERKLKQLPGRGKAVVIDLNELTRLARSLGKDVRSDSVGSANGV